MEEYEFQDLVDIQKKKAKFQIDQDECKVNDIMYGNNKVNQILSNPFDQLKYKPLKKFIPKEFNTTLLDKVNANELMKIHFNRYKPIKEQEEGQCQLGQILFINTFKQNENIINAKFKIGHNKSIKNVQYAVLNSNKRKFQKQLCSSEKNLVGPFVENYQEFSQQQNEIQQSNKASTSLIPFDKKKINSDNKELKLQHYDNQSFGQVESQKEDNLFKSRQISPRKKGDQFFDKRVSQNQSAQNQGIGTFINHSNYRKTSVNLEQFQLNKEFLQKIFNELQRDESERTGQNNSQFKTFNSRQNINQNVVKNISSLDYQFFNQKPIQSQLQTNKPYIPSKLSKSSKITTNDYLKLINKKASLNSDYASMKQSPFTSQNQRYYHRQQAEQYEKVIMTTKNQIQNFIDPTMRICDDEGDSSNNYNRKFKRSSFLQIQSSSNYDHIQTQDYQEKTVSQVSYYKTLKQVFMEKARKSQNLQPSVMNSQTQNQKQRKILDMNDGIKLQQYFDDIE